MAEQVVVKKEPEDIPSDDDGRVALDSEGAAVAPDNESGGAESAVAVKREVDDCTYVEVKQERSEDFEKLLEYGLDVKVASRLDDIYNTGEKSRQICEIRTVRLS